MTDRNLFIKELNCESCEHVIRKIASRHSVTVEGVDFRKKIAKMKGEEHQISNTADELNAMGYAASFEKIPEKGKGASRFMAFLSGTLSGKENFKAQSKSLEIFVYSLVGLLFLTTLIVLANILPVAPYLYYVYLSALGTAILLGTIWHISEYFDNFTHMNGMMVGMTLGMSAGFLAGAIIGATNGMFIGSVVGMAAGILVGAYWGNCCGVMGILEGTMGGVMAGTMGAMLSVMMVLDHLNEFLALLFISFAAILLGLNYMVFKETIGETPKAPTMNKTILLAAVAHLIMMAVIAFGPRGIGVAFN
ncbi:MAG: hypothetical protein ABH863_00845 [Candidatus Micrarchaeota archaeon]